MRYDCDTVDGRYPPPPAMCFQTLVWLYGVLSKRLVGFMINFSLINTQGPSSQTKLPNNWSFQNPELWVMYIKAALTKSKEICCLLAVMYFCTLRKTGLAVWLWCNERCAENYRSWIKLYQGVNYNYDLEESCDPLKKSVIFRRKKKNIKKSKGLLRLSLSQTAFTPTLK